MLLDKKKPAQADLFGVAQKREQAKQAAIEKNKADKVAGIKPVQEPLLSEAEEADGT